VSGIIVTSDGAGEVLWIWDVVYLVDLRVRGK
jgi:hypothetical protein